METTIRTGNDPVLKQISEPVQHGEDLSGLFDSMRELMGLRNELLTEREAAMEVHRNRRAIGLAAPQVGVLKRAIIIAIPGGLEAEIINPVIVKRSSGRIQVNEGCMSFPDQSATVRRHKSVTVKGWDRDWKPVQYRCQKVTAWCVQHEVDHLNGVTIL